MSPRGAAAPRGFHGERMRVEARLASNSASCAASESSTAFRRASHSDTQPRRKEASTHAHAAAIWLAAWGNSFQ